MKKVVSYICPFCKFSSSINHSTCPACGRGNGNITGFNKKYTYKGDSDSTI